MARKKRNIKKRNYLARVIDDKDPASAKRFLAILLSFHLVISGFYILFFNKLLPNQDLLKMMLIIDSAIIGVSILGMSVQDYAKILMQISKISNATTLLSTKKLPENSQLNEDGETKEIGDDVLDDNQDLEKIRKNLTNSLTDTE